MTTKQEMVGKVYGLWKVLSLDLVTKARSNREYPNVNCVCRCGTPRSVNAMTLKRGKSVSCGCHRAAVLSALRTTHGQSIHRGRHGNTKEYRAWVNIKTRCYNPAGTDYHIYGGIGVTMCREWRRSFDAFFAYLGRAPSPAHSVDRIDPYGNYEPGNVRWATAKEQANNKRAKV